MQSKVWKKIETGLLQNLICAAAKMRSKRTDALGLKVKVYMILLKGWMMTADWCVRTAFELEKRGRGLSFPVCRSQEWQDVDRSGAKLVDPASVCATLQCSVFTIDQTTLPCANSNTASVCAERALQYTFDLFAIHYELNYFGMCKLKYCIRD